MLMTICPTFPLASAVAAPPQPSLVMVFPFALMLLSMAVLPLFAPAFWGANMKRIVIGLGAIAVGYYVFGLGATHRVLVTAADYVSFIVFIGSLYVVAGGIHIQVKGEAKPWVNCVFLLLGALIANVIGTTGASMLLIRPWVRMNKYRFTNLHTAFFIFIVSNVGGCLTPVGDPPLFLGYLKGVPFWWIAQRCAAPWATAVGLLLGLFYLLDRANFVRAPRAVRMTETAHETWKFAGLRNLAFLAVILGAVFIKGFPGLRELVMAAAAYGSYRTTSRQVHESNGFSFAPIEEVAWLFAGIFATMTPALDFVQNNAARLGISAPRHFYWLSGGLSSVLDNAPTYLAFSAVALGLRHLDLNNPAHLAVFLQNDGIYVVAISLGSVFFGAMTYIGNGPNLMVKALADHAGVHTPNFFAYIFKFSLLALLPILAFISYAYLPK